MTTKHLKAEGPHIFSEKDIRYDFNRNLILTNKKITEKLIKYNFLFEEIKYKLIK